MYTESMWWIRIPSLSNTSSARTIKEIYWRRTYWGSRMGRWYQRRNETPGTTSTIRGRGRLLKEF